MTKNARVMFPLREPKPMVSNCIVQLMVMQWQLMDKMQRRCREQVLTKINNTHWVR